jgi:hypothetical protein
MLLYVIIVTLLGSFSFGYMVGDTNAYKKINDELNRREDVRRYRQWNSDGRDDL